VIWLLAIQVATFVALGVLFLAGGQLRLGIAQLLLAAVQAVIYSGRMA
jgi:hypothetical protein